MKIFVPFALFIFLTPVFIYAQKHNDPEAGWLSQAQTNIEKSEYFFTGLSPFSFAAVNQAQKTVYNIDAKGYSVTLFNNSFNENHAGWKSHFSVFSIDKGAAVIQPRPRPIIKIKDNTLLQDHEQFDIEYINNSMGLRQNFIIKQQPSGKKELKVRVALKNTYLSPRLIAGQVLQLTDNDENVVLQYDGLKVWDANNIPLTAYMKLSGEATLDIIVDDRNANYPVTVDPLNHTAEWSGSALGILPSLTGQLSVDAAYGFSVAGLGDVNGDGYDDVAIGAPGLANLISGSGTLASVGAVFIYYGSSTGLPVTPSKKLQSSTALAGALFGFSIDAGDITGDGKNDIIIGAPMDSYQTSARGLLGNPTVTVKSGKVYVYRSEDLSSSNPSPFLQIKLGGTDFFSTGVLGLLLSNITSTNLFGYSVAVTDDLNHDGKKDIIVGSPGFLGISLLSVKQGAAFVYYSDNLSTTSPAQLNLPSTSLLGLNLSILNLGGLLYGYSVDGAGDYNNDGYNDVVVGAPAGIDLSSLGGVLTGQVLGGSAYVYYGKPAGEINSTIGATLHAEASGLLSNTANLFGYKVKGVKDAAGIRNGNILIGAPLGGAITNLLGGLQVKTGTVSVFIKNAASGIITPNQQLSSPRNDNSILGIIQSSLLFGFSIDNTGDVNCDGFADIVVGEPASSGAALIGANVAGGSAYIFAGNPDGTYQTSPAWSLGVTYEASLGVNLVSLAGYSVAGAGRVKGISGSNKVLVGAPGRSLDFGAGLLNLGNTASTLFGLVAGDNGVGKSYLFESGLCVGGSEVTLPLMITKFNALLSTSKKVLLTWEVSSENQVSSFMVERSTDGNNWKTITVVFVTDESRKNTYSVNDNDPDNGMNYYRLKQTDMDGKLFYSTIRTISILEKHIRELKASNPFNHSIRVQLKSEKDNIAVVRLTDMSGKTIIRKMVRVSAGNNSFQIDNLSGLAPNMYIIHVVNENEHYIQKLIKK